MSLVVTEGQSLTVTGNIVGANVLATNETRLSAIEDKAIFNQVNVKDYGAVGDGVTDDTSAIQLALNQGGYVVFDNATYLFTSLTLSSNTIIDGKGAILKSIGENTTSFYFTGKSNIEIKNLEIYGSATEVISKTGYQYHGVYGYNSSNILIDNIKVHDMPNGGIFFVDCSYVTVKNCRLYNNLDGADISFGYGDTENLITNFICTDNICESSNRYGIRVQGTAKDILVDGNIVKSKGEYGLLFYSYSTPISQVRVTNNHVEDVSHNADEAYYSGMGIYLQTINNVVCSNNIVKDVLQDRPDSTTNRTLLPGAISISSCAGVTCEGNIIDGSGKDGISITKTANTADYPCLVNGNSIRNVVDYAIYAVDLNNTIISNNSIVNDTTAATAILVGSSSIKDAYNISVSGNRMRNCVNGISITKGTGTAITNITINNNSLVDIANSYINFNTAYDIIVTNNICKAKTVAATASTYVIQLSACTNANIMGNICTGESSYKLARGIVVSNSTNVLIQSNTLYQLSDVYYSIYESGTNTKVFFYDNITERQTQPFRDGHNIGNIPATDTSIKIIYKTSIPVSGDGYFGAGSVCYNLTPSAGGTIGWVCVSAGTPGTWKEFGTIAS